jgi:hypothetical protein
MTMQDDGTGRERPREEKPLTLPAVKSAVARRVRYEKPRRFVAHGKEYTESDVIEIDVETDAEFPLAGIGPALFVGNVPIIDSVRVAERRYRFFAPASLALRKGAPIALGRAGSGVPVPEQKAKLKLEWSGEVI